MTQKGTFQRKYEEIISYRKEITETVPAAGFL
jgi:hypothetical protein